MNIERHIIVVLWIIICTTVNVTHENECMNLKTPLSSMRKRRHLTFPDKSDVVLTLSLLKALMTHAPSGWNLVLEIDVIYHLPDSKYINAQFRKKLYYRQKREFWDRLSSAIGLHNINGRLCILKSICEAKVYLASPGKSLVHDILRAVFTVPLEDQDFTEETKTNYAELNERNFCDRPYDCPFSLIDFILTLNKRN